MLTLWLISHDRLVKSTNHILLPSRWASDSSSFWHVPHAEGSFSHSCLHGFLRSWEQSSRWLKWEGCWSRSTYFPFLNITFNAKFDHIGKKKKRRSSTEPNLEQMWRFLRSRMCWLYDQSFIFGMEQFWEGWIFYIFCFYWKQLIAIRIPRWLLMFAG